MKKLFRIAIVVSVLMAILAVAGCGKKEEDPGTDPDPQETKVEILGANKVWGSFQVFVPNGMILTGGSLIDIEDPDSLWIQPKESGLDCFQITKMDKDAVDKDIKAAKEAYETSDISKFSTDEISWTGISYLSGDKKVQILKGICPGGCLEVIITGFEYNSDTAMAILEGIQIL